MNQAAPRPADQVDRGLAYLCEHRSYIEKAIARRPAAQRAALTRLTEPGGSTDVATDLETVHEALQSAGVGRGIFGNVRGLLYPAGVDQDESEPVLRCPRPQHPCPRIAQPSPGTTPQCELTGAPLARGDVQR